MPRLPLVLGLSLAANTALLGALALPSPTATQVWTVQKEIQQRSETIRADSQFTLDQRTAQLAGLTAEATTCVTTVLGPRGLAEYQNNGGNWLQRLTPPPSPTSPPPP